MTVRFIILALVLAVVRSYSAEPSPPFARVVRSGESVVATLPASGGRFVLADSPQPRTTLLGESFAFRDGASLSLVEKHSSYRITCHLLPRAGLQIEATFNAQSFG